MRLCEIGKDARYFHKTTNLIKWTSTLNNSGAVGPSTLFMMMACRKRHTSTFAAVLHLGHVFVISETWCSLKIASSGKRSDVLSSFVGNKHYFSWLGPLKFEKSFHFSYVCLVHPLHIHCLYNITIIQGLIIIEYDIKNEILFTIWHKRRHVNNTAK